MSVEVVNYIADLNISLPAAGDPKSEGDDHTRNIKKALKAGQIPFPAVQAASSDPNTLDDYEEGTWTPSENTIGALAVAVGTYEKIGRFVIARAYMQWPNTADTTLIVINGLPFATANSNAARQAFIGFTSLPANAGFIFPVANSTQSQLYKSDGVTRANNANVDLQTIVATWFYPIS